MASPQTSNGAKGKLKMKAIDAFSYDKLPPDLPSGKWRFTIDKAVARATQKGQPMISLKFKVEEAFDDEHESLVGKSIDELVIFYADNDEENSRAAKMNKVRIRQLCEAAEVDLDAIPKRIGADGAELEQFAETLRGQSFEAWTIVKTQDSGEQRTNVMYTEPGGGLSLAEPEAEDEPPARGAKGKTKGKR